MSLVLHIYPPSPRSLKVLLTAEYLGLDYRLNRVDLARGEQKLPAFLALNPNGKVPTLVDGDVVLWEANAIIEYLAFKAGNTILPASGADRLGVSKWLYWECAHWDAALTTLIFEYVAKPLLGLGAPDAAALARGQGLIDRFAPVLEAQVAQHDFVAGAQLSAADLALAAPLLCIDDAASGLSAYPHIRRWRDRLSALPAWKRVSAIEDGATIG